MASCRFVLLGVPVVVRSTTDAILKRIELCYSALTSHKAVAGDPVIAAVEPGGAGWRVDVTGRPTVEATTVVDAIRNLNHELVHGLMLRRRDLFYVHAGVVSLGGEAMILPGLSRAGKSTLVLAMLQQGASFLSDELLVFDPLDKTLLPFPRALKIRDECVGYFPSLSERFVGTGEARFLPFDALDGLQIAPSARPGHIAAPQWQAGVPDTIRALSRGEGLVHLTGSTLNFGSHGAGSIDHLADLLGTVTCSLVTWSDPHAAAGLLLETMRRRRSELPS